MLEYKEPDLATKIVENGEYKFPPYSCWPSIYIKPDINKWRNAAKPSFTRNLIITLLHYFNVTSVEITGLMELSDSRIRAILKSTKKRLFGKNYTPSIEEIQIMLPLLRDKSKTMREYASQRIENLEGNMPELKAIFHALSMSNYDSTDIQLYHHVICYLESKVGEIDINKYEN